MTAMTQMTFAAAVQRFEKASPWLSDEHAPAVAALRAMATELDAGELAPAMLSQFGLAFRALRKEAPRAGDVDPLAQALEEAEAS